MGVFVYTTFFKNLKENIILMVGLWVFAFFAP